MSNLTKKNKHLILDDRIEIQECLNLDMTFKAIARRIGKDPTTVSKEIKRHIIVRESTVKRTREDGSKLAQPCPRLMNAPFVCNPCERRSRACAFDKHIYDAKHAQKAYETLLVEAREGIPLNKESFYEMDAIVSDRVKKGQHIYHIMKSNDIGVSKSTVYRHLNRGYLSVSAVEFPRVVKFKPRKKKPIESIPKSIRIGRTYDDFLAFVQENAVTSWVEMDTVIGRAGGKTIMTFDFTFCNFMFGLLLEDKSSAQVSEKILPLKSRLVAAGKSFGDIFSLTLTDNGGAFSNVAAFENSSRDVKEASVFFCDPMRSNQKPRVEKNHTLFRDIVPKGHSFDGFTQSDVDLIFSHVNSVKRKSLNGRTSYEMFRFAFSEDVAGLLGIYPVPAEHVIQSPALLKK